MVIFKGNEDKDVHISLINRLKIIIYENSIYKAWDHFGMLKLIYFCLIDIMMDN